ncbi:MAG: hypothetical protein J5I52_05815 [Saprospiraceae bacterium]|nr:MAG: hypothetical protein UZ09_BCD002000774 [Bacteroidetes bacterium OLB9]MCO6463648.1 hypothetical protein [Saprospiraceae bacterium]MCZ2338868.1 hypothetical protein [Chitinophagales bacterium]
MRIIGEFDLKEIKVTVFKYGERFSVKYEYNFMEQTLKFRDGSGINTYADIKTFSESIENEIVKAFDIMEKARMNGLMQFYQDNAEDFDEII